MITTRRVALVAFGLLLLVVAVDGWLLLDLRRSGVTTRMRRTTLESLADERRQAPADLEIARQAVRRVMNMVDGVASTPDLPLAELRRHVDAGGGVNCDGMARLALDELRHADVPARMVTVFREVGDPLDSHVTVEVLTEQGWAVLDPTFHVQFRGDGEWLAAAEVSTRLRRDPRSVTPVFLGEVRYPPRVETYYLPWQELFRHILVYDRDGDETDAVATRALRRVPPTRFWWGPSTRYVGHDGDAPIRAAATRYVLAVAVLPTVAAALMLVAGLSGVSWALTARPAPEARR